MHAVQHWASAWYEQTGNTVPGENGAAALLAATVCH